jgi:heme-degrading monooxygenase HmoA
MNAMYIAMNRFQVKKDRGGDFEQMWRDRESYLDEVPGYKEFHLLKGAEEEDFILYSSHTLWESYDHFVDWTKSEAFRKAHANAGNQSDPIILGHPKFEGFEIVLTK